MKRILLLLSFLLALGLPTLASCISEGDEAAEGGDIVKPGMPLPSFCVTLNDGTVFSTDSCTGPIVLVFFNTGCSDCRRELPIVQGLYEEFAPMGVNFLCVSRKKGAESIAGYWTKEKLTLPYSAQEGSTLFERFAARSIPRIYVAGTDGVVTSVFVEKASERRLRRAIEAAIGR